MDVKELLSMEYFFEKIGSYIKNEDFIADIRKISMLRDIDKKLLEDLIDCCDKKEQIVISYNSPNSGQKDIELIADKIEVANGKMYLLGTGFEYMQYGSFLVSRIKGIKEIKIEKTIPDNLQEFRIIYTLEGNPDKFNPADNERIIEKHNNYVVIEMKTSNDFLAKQKLLEYGPTCKVVAPEDFRNDFIKLLKDMKAGYYCG